MKLIKGILLLLIVTTFSVSFTACSDDDRKWGELLKTTESYNPPPRTDANGRFYEELFLDVRDIRGYSSSDYLQRIVLYNSNINIRPINYADVLPSYIGGEVNLYISADRIGGFECRTYVDRDGGIYIDTRDSKFARFMSDVFNEISVVGGVNLIIEGVLRQYNNNPIQFLEFDIVSYSEVSLIIRD